MKKVIVIILGIIALVIDVIWAMFSYGDFRATYGEQFSGITGGLICVGAHIFAGVGIVACVIIILRMKKDI